MKTANCSGHADVIRLRDKLRLHHIGHLAKVVVDQLLGTCAIS